MSPLDLRSIRWRYLTLIGLRWLPTGFLIPVVALVPLSRGLTLTEIGVVFSMVGVVVLVLELPTGGLSDSLGRRPVLIAASGLSILSLGLFTVADSFGLFLTAMAIQGVFRALDSGPLEAWYVDQTLHADPEASIERGLSYANSILGVAIASGALLSGGLVALHPIASIEPLTLPLLVALALGVINLGAIVTLLSEAPRARDPKAVARSIRAVPGVVAEGLGLLRGSRVLAALVAVEVFWGFSMVTFETFFPIRLSGLVGGEDAAAAIMGPVGSAAWLAAAGGAGGVLLLSRRIGVARAAVLLRVTQGATIVFMGLVSGVAGVVAAYLACYVAHGASNPLHTTLLHRQVDSAHRTTVLSMNSMVSMPAFAVGGVVLATLADATSLPTAIVVGGVICAIAAPLYLPAWRAERAARVSWAVEPAVDSQGV
ncbi:MAG TPA: MFS transporter [Candidatus Limnocylindrales bacterium]|jgi:MFS family permease|nr:MFS transporter [Candidatus Limnocylindrales bacterium]